MIKRRTSVNYNIGLIEGQDDMDSLLDIGSRLREARSSIRHSYGTQVEIEVKLSTEAKRWYVDISERGTDSPHYVQAVRELIKIAGEPSIIDLDYGEVTSAIIREKGKRLVRSWRDFWMARRIAPTA